MPRATTSRRLLQFSIRGWLLLAALLAWPLAEYGQRIETWWRTPQAERREATSLCWGILTERITLLEEDESLLGLDLADQPIPASR